MTDYQLSAKAVEDLSAIYDYTMEEFGVAKADAYLDGLEETFLNLAQSPGIAHGVEDIRKGYLRYLYQSHTIYFTQTTFGILVVRVLHQRMRATLHLG